MCSTEQEEDETLKKLIKTYIGTSFAIYVSLIPNLRNKLTESQKIIADLQNRRKEDSKANARVVEIYANHRQAWQNHEKRLSKQIEDQNAIILNLRTQNDNLVHQREQLLGFLAQTNDSRVSLAHNECLEDEISSLFAGSKLWKPNTWNQQQQDVQYESVEPLYDLKQFVSRREYPWNVDGETAGVFSKLKSLEQDLLNLEVMGKSELSKIPSQMRKQAKRYQALAGKIDDLCRRMQASDPSEANLSSEFRTQCQTEFLLEAFRLKHRSNETSQKLIALQTETGKSYFRNEVESQAKLTFKRCLDSVKNSLKEIQRNLEIWLARIIGDLEGVLARDGRVREWLLDGGYPLAQ